MGMLAAENLCRKMVSSSRFRKWMIMSVRARVCEGVSVGAGAGAGAGVEVEAVPAEGSV